MTLKKTGDKTLIFNYLRNVILIKKDSLSIRGRKESERWHDKRRQGLSRKDTQDKAWVSQSEWVSECVRVCVCMPVTQGSRIESRWDAVPLNHTLTSLHGLAWRAWTMFVLTHLPHAAIIPKQYGLPHELSIRPRATRSRFLNHVTDSTLLDAGFPNYWVIIELYMSDFFLSIL